VSSWHEPGRPRQAEGVVLLFWVAFVVVLGLCVLAEVIGA
jgi:hypothetical protein